MEQLIKSLMSLSYVELTALERKFKGNTKLVSLIKGIKVKKLIHANTEHVRGFITATA